MGASQYQLGITGPGSTHGTLTTVGNKATSIIRSGIVRSLNSDLSNAGLLDNGSDTLVQRHR